MIERIIQPRSIPGIIAGLLMILGSAICSQGSDLAEKPTYEEFMQKAAADAINWPRKLNPVHVVVVFTKFKGEAPGDTLAPSWAKDLFSGNIGSIPHFFDSVSFGQYKVTGEYLPRRYELPSDSSYYDNVFTYSHDLVMQLDADPTINFGLFDNEGPDGIPNSGDDDGYVDYMIFMPRSRPYDFIQQLATGVMYLGLIDPYRTSDRNRTGDHIIIDKTSGCISTAATKNEAVGTIIAELAHAYGAVDLMDKTYVTPESDSSGLGYWDILSRGALGWDEHDGPVGPSAYNRIMMNCVGPYNANLVDIYGIHQGVRMKDVGHPDGKIFRLWITSSEYYLIEYRSKIGGNYYDRQIPRSGILIYHVDEKGSNVTEKEKLVDLECADGRFIDKGYPYGEIPDPLKGSDNLDFWAHDYTYTRNHFGNQGDATDVFDGVTFKNFGTETNPNTYSHKTNRPTGIEIYNIHPEGDEMVFDCYIPPIPDRTPDDAPTIGLGFQRSNASYNNQYLTSWIKEIYLVNFGLSEKPDILVTIKNDNMYIDPLHFIKSYEAQKAVERYLLADNTDNSNVRIARKFISPTEFNSIISDFGARPGDLGSSGTIRWVQKVYAETDSETPPAVIGIDLMQNYPNPFNSQTTVSYILSTGGPARLEVYNILGQRVMLVDQGFKEAGMHSLRLDASNLPSGMYMYRLSGMALSDIRKFTLIK
ncbi:T9SS type A sorting domain-containing protein [bacterium]|nr:T9SS type A sorting domain-containing protein [bacterium]